MSNPSPRVSFVAVAAMSLAITGCGSTIQMDGVKKSISEGLAAQVGLHAETVTCPESREAKANDVFQCTVTPKEGGTLTIEVTQKDDRGNIDWKVVRTEGLLDLAKVEESVKEGLKQQANVDATVSCGSRWRAAAKGDTFDCEATTAAGEAVGIRVSVTDDEGNIQWGTK